MSGFTVQHMSTLETSILLDGAQATADVLSPLAFAGFAHFTAMQVRSGKVRGLDLHIARLVDASAALFARTLDEKGILSEIRGAIAQQTDDHSLVVTVFSHEGEFVAQDPASELGTLIRTALPSSGPLGPLKLATFEHERFMPEYKHVGEGAKTLFLQRARDAGFDDALFVDQRGHLSEGSIWNLAFWDAGTVVWPQAAMLHGTTMGILRRQLEHLGVPQRFEELRGSDVYRFSGAVVMNSWTPGVAVNMIDSFVFPPAADFVELLHDAYLAEPSVSPSQLMQK